MAMGAYCSYPGGGSGNGKSRRTWTAPALRRMEAGAAEAGANPVNPEGAFAQGS